MSLLVCFSFVFSFVILVLCPFVILVAYVGGFSHWQVSFCGFIITIYNNIQAHAYLHFGTS